MDRRAFVAGAVGLALAPRALAKNEPLAVVTADLESHLVVVTLASGHPVTTIRTEAFPRSVENVGGLAVVAHSDIGVVSLVKPFVRAHVLRGFGEPRYTAAHPSGRYAYVSDAARGEVVAIDIVRRAVLSRTNVGPLARHITISPNGRQLWVALGSKAAHVAVLGIGNAPYPRYLHTITPPFLAHDVGLAPDGRHAWVTSGDRERVAIYDRGRLVRTIDADWPPQHVTFSGNRAYVTSGWSGTVRVHTLDGRQLRRNPVPVGSYNVQYADGRVLTPSLGHGWLTVLDEAGTTVWSKKLARSSHDACVV
ncbi:MAG: YncE family protein [Gaiellaceae bacterium]